MIRKIMLPLLIAFLLLCLALPAPAKETSQDEKPWKRFSLKLGGAANTTDSSVRLGVNGLGLAVDVEEILNLESSTSTFAVEGFWRFTKRRRHRLDFSWLAFHRSAETMLGRDITIGDLDLPLGTKVNTNLNIDIYRVGYSYSFFQDDRIDLGIGIGTYVLPIKFDITASGLIRGAESESITAPLPVFNVRADFAITPKWFLRSSFDLFYLELFDFKGGIADSKVAIEYNPFKHVGFGLSFNSFKLKVEAEESVYPGVDFLGSFEYDSLGVMAYLNFYFGK
jgi:hypothetical protein